MQVNPLNQLYKDFLTILDEAVIKFSYVADKDDTVDMRRDADRYMKAYTQEDTFSTYVRYEPEVLMDVLRLDESEVTPYYLDKNLIPLSMRELVLAKQRQYIIDNYEEKNDYYRTINGLPPYNSTPLDYIYVDKEMSDLYNIPEGQPIHEVDSAYIALLLNNGYLGKLMEANPDKKYLHYLGNNRVDIVSARRANNFSLLRVPTSITETLLRSFTLIYEQCREYFMTCIYIPEYRQTINMYDNFIGLCIMIMTIQQVLARIIKNTTDRDFFDPYCCKLLFNAYGVPYNANVDPNTRNRLVQNLNMLVKNKGTSKVIYDIGSILGFSKIEIYKYYLMRVRQFNSQGVPMEYYKDSEKTELDYQRMYDVYFQKVYLDDDDFYSALTDTNNKVPYIELVEEDPYWVEDEALMKELYESEYNYVESKYMGVSISYRLTQILLQNIYLLRMIVDKKNEIGSISLDLSKISSNGLVSLFDTVITLCAMTCKQNGLNGELVTKFTHVLYVMGFSFEKDFPLIKQTILEDPYLDDTLIDFFQNPATYTADRINELYDSFINLHDTLVEKMSTTQDINVYHAYKKFYDSIFYTKGNQELFNMGTKDEPIYAETYMDYLKFANPEIHDFIEETKAENMYVYIEYIIAKLMEILPQLSQSGSVMGTSTTLEELFMQLIRFFKSYTTDIVNLSSIYIFDLKPATMVRLIDWAMIHKNMKMQDDLYLAYADNLHYTTKAWYSTALTVADKIHHLMVGMALSEDLHYYDTIYEHVRLWLNDMFNYNKTLYKMVDVIFHEHNNLTLDDYAQFLESMYLMVGIDLREYVNTRKFTIWDDYVVKVEATGRGELKLTDDQIHHSRMLFNELKLFNMHDKMDYISRVYGYDNYNMMISVVSMMYKMFVMNEYDGVMIDIPHHIQSDSSISDKTKLMDAIKHDITAYGYDHYMTMVAMVKFVHNNLIMNEDAVLVEDVHYIHKDAKINEYHNFMDKVKSTINIYGFDAYRKFMESIFSVYKKLYMVESNVVVDIEKHISNIAINEEAPQDLMDTIHSFTEIELPHNSNFTMVDKYFLLFKSRCDEMYNLRDKEQISNRSIVSDRKMLYDKTHTEGSGTIYWLDRIDMLEKIKYIMKSLSMSEENILTDIEKHVSNFPVHDGFKKFYDECTISFSD